MDLHQKFLYLALTLLLANTTKATNNTNNTATTTTKAATTTSGTTRPANTGDMVSGGFTLDLGTDGPTIMANATKRNKLNLAIQKAISGMDKNVAERDVKIRLTLARRLQEGRQLATKKIKVDFQIQLPANKRATEFATGIKSTPGSTLATAIKSSAAAVGGLPTLTPTVSGMTAAAVPKPTNDSRVARIGMLIVTLIVSVWY